MWYRIKLAAMDMGPPPPVWDRTVCQGQDLIDVVAEAAMQLHNAAEQLRHTTQLGLRGLLFAGLELEVWDSWNSFVEFDAAAEDFRRVMRSYVMDHHNFSSGSPSIGTPTTANGSSQSS